MTGASNGAAAGAPEHRRTGLPPEPNRFVGRAPELSRLADLLASGRRLVTVLGPPGVGKTRLVVRFAAAAAARGRVIFCDLTEARDVDAMGAAVARTLGIAGDGPMAGQDAARVVGRALAARGPALLVLDNVEQLLPAAAAVLEAWLGVATGAAVLVTSRALLGLRDETVLEIAPMRVPGHGSSELTDAMELFIDRVRSVRGRYAPGGDGLHAIAEVVRRLNGLPLAIELAASQMNATSPAQLLPRLERRLELLHGGVTAAGAPRALRQMTMYQAVDWSWELLHPSERAALTQCSVFRGGFTVGAAEAVLRLPPEAAGAPVRQLLRSLREKSLLRTEEPRHADEPPRFGMYESIRAFASSKLAHAGATRAVAARHAEYYLALTGPLAGMPGVGGASGLPADIDRERENLQAALEFGAAAGRPFAVLRAAIALDALAEGNGLSGSQLGLLDAALDRAQTRREDTATGAHEVDRDQGLEPQPERQRAQLVARARGVRATILRSLGRLAEAADDARAALALVAAHGGPQAQILALRSALGEALFGLGELDAALAQYDLALVLARGDARAEAMVVQQIGAVHQTLGRRGDAREHYEQALRLALAAGDRRAEARAALSLGSYHLELELFTGSDAYYQRGLALARALRMRRSERVVLGYLGVLHFDHGLIDEAGAYLAEAIAAAQSAGDVRVEGVFQAVYGAVRATEDRLDESEAAFATVDGLLEGNPFFRAVASVYRGHLELAAARRAQARGAPGAARSLREAARGRAVQAREADGDHGPGPLVARSDDARIAVRILERAIDRA